METKRVTVRVLTGPQVVVFADNAQYIAVVVQTLDLATNFVMPMYILTTGVPAIGKEVYPIYHQGRTRELIYV